MADKLYDIEAAFESIEDELLASLKRRLERNITDTLPADESYKIWQVEQLEALEQYRYLNDTEFTQRFADINERIQKMLASTSDAAKQAEVQHIQKLISKGALAKHVSADIIQLLNKNKLDALIKSVIKDMTTAEYATLRRMDDEYRRIIYNAQVYLNTSSGTLRQAIDMASRDFYAAGIDSIQYKNGARVNITSYSEMALRTANTRATLQGEAAARDEYGLNLVIVTRRGVACPRCQKYCGRVCIDDVYGNGKPDGEHDLLSSFIAGGLYHPNCKDSHTTYYPDISPDPQPMTAAEQAEANRIYQLEQQQRYNERQIRKYKRLEENQLSPANQQDAANRRKQWQSIQRDFIKNHPELRRKYEREQI